MPQTALVVALEQTEGRGRQGRSWVSTAGRGLYCTWLQPLPVTGAGPAAGPARRVAAPGRDRRVSRAGRVRERPGEPEVAQRRPRGRSQDRRHPDRDGCGQPGRDGRGDRLRGELRLRRRRRTADAGGDIARSGNRTSARAGSRGRAARDDAQTRVGPRRRPRVHPGCLLSLQRPSRGRSRELPDRRRDDLRPVRGLRRRRPLPARGRRPVSARSPRARSSRREDGGGSPRQETATTSR